MMAKIIKGNSISTCLNYVTRLKHDGHPEIKREWFLLDSDGVRFREGEKDWRKRVIADIKRPNAQRCPIKAPCGHTSLEFKPEDAPKLTDELMLKIAEEYLDKVGIRNTPYVIVRHTNTPHPHCHIVFSRVDYDGKIINSATDFYLNGGVCKEITEQYGLAWGEDKMGVDPRKLKGKERARYEIAQGIADTLVINRNITDFRTLQDELKKRGIGAKPIFDSGNRIKTIIYKKGRYSFVASKIDRHFTPSGLLKIFNKNKELNQQHSTTNPQAVSKQAASTESQSPGSPIRLTTLSSGHAQQDDFPMINGEPISGDFKQFLENHPGMDFVDAKRMFEREQRAKAKARQRPKLHM